MQASDRKLTPGEMPPLQTQSLAYWQKLSMDRDPFDASVRESFTLPSWQRSFELIEHLVQFNNVIVNILAEPGMGKSVFANRLTEKLNGNALTHRLSASAGLSRSDLVKQILTPFQLTNVPVAMQNEFVSIINERKQHCLLVIDNAHQLSIDILMYLKKCIIMQDDLAYFHITLLGEPALMDKVNSIMKPSEQEKLMHNIELPTMCLEEVYAYLNHCFSTSSFSGELPLSTHALTKIYKGSGGNMAKVSALAKEAIIEQLGTKREPKAHTQFKLSKQSTSIGAGLICVFLLAVTYNFIARDDKPDDSLELAQESASPTRVELTPAKPVSSLDKVQLSQQSLGGREDAKVAVMTEKRPQYVVNQTQTRRVNTLRDFSPPESTPERVLEDRALSQEPSQKELLRAISAARQNQRRDTPVLMDKVIVMPSIHTEGLREVVTKPSLKRTAEPAKKIVSRQQAKPIRKVRQTTKTPTKHRRVVTTRVPQSAIKPSPSKRYRYTVQVLATSKLSSLDDFIQRYQIADKVSTYRVKKGKETWYILAWGKYSDYGQAKQAIKNLPSNLRVYSPWPRSLASLKPKPAA